MSWSSYRAPAAPPPRRRVAALRLTLGLVSREAFGTELTLAFLAVLFMPPVLLSSALGGRSGRSGT